MLFTSLLTKLEWNFEPISVNDIEIGRWKGWKKIFCNLKAEGETGCLFANLLLKFEFKFNISIYYDANSKFDAF